MTRAVAGSISISVSVGLGSKCDLARAAPKAKVKVSAMAAVFSGSVREESTFKPTHVVLAGGRALLTVGQGGPSSQLHQ